MFGVSEEKSRVFNKKFAAPMKSHGVSIENLELVSNENLRFNTKSLGSPMRRSYGSLTPNIVPPPLSSLYKFLRPGRLQSIARELFIFEYLNRL